MRYEQLMIDNNNILIDDTHVLPHSFSGVYLDNMILIDKHLSTYRKLEVLAEEVAHYKITLGDIINPKKSLNKYLENKARRLSCEMLISLDDLIDAHQHGVESLFEMTEYFEITTECVQACIEHYKSKYGLNVKHKEYLISFEPLQVQKLTTDN